MFESVGMVGFDGQCPAVGEDLFVSSAELVERQAEGVFSVGTVL